jgi:hypothetical protein
MRGAKLRHRSVVRGRRRVGGDELRAGEFRETTAFDDEFVERARLDDLAMLEHENPVSMADRRQAMRDDKRRAPLGRRLQRELQLPLGLGVER